MAFQKTFDPDDVLYKDETTVNEDDETETEGGLNEDAQNIMRKGFDDIYDADEDGNKDLEAMRKVVMRIRDDPIYAATFYDDCPRLQLKLIEHPDLRPIFEDPDLVRINFEEVFRKAGGKLPEDEDDETKPAAWRRVLKKIVSHPLFRVLRFILLIKKLVGCVTGGGYALVQGCMQRLCCDAFGEAALTAVDLDGAGEGVAYANPNNAASKAALNSVADHMENPEVAAAMDELLEKDPDELQEAIENDPELRALRDSNPMCAELMSDPETFKILVDPDNLRALAECPDLIEADLADPDWAPPDIEQVPEGDVDGEFDPETGEYSHTVADDNYNYDVDYDSGADDYGANYDDEYRGATTTTSATTDLAEIAADDVDAEGEAEEADEVEQEEGDMVEDFELGEGQEVGDIGPVDLDAEEGEEEEGHLIEEEEEEAALVEDFEMGEAQEGDNNMSSRSGGKSGGRPNNQNQNRGGGFLSQVGGGISNLLVGELVGGTMDDFMPGGDGFEDLTDNAGDDAADQAEAAGDSALAVSSTAENANSLADATGDFSDRMETVEDYSEGLDTVEDAADKAEEKAEEDGQTDRTAVASAGAAGVACAVAPIPPGGHTAQNPEEEEKKKGKFGWVGGLAASVSTAAKESVAGALFGADLGEWLVEKQEEAGESDSKEDDKEKAGEADSEDDDKEEGGEKTRRRDGV